MRLKVVSRTLGEGSKDLVILHGVLGSADNWQTLGKRYAEDFRVHLVDVRNHGRTHTEDHNYGLMVAFQDVFRCKCISKLTYLSQHGR